MRGVPRAQRASERRGERARGLDHSLWPAGPSGVTAFPIPVEGMGKMKTRAELENHQENSTAKKRKRGANETEGN